MFDEEETKNEKIEENNEELIEQDTEDLNDDRQENTEETSDELFSSIKKKDVGNKSMRINIIIAVVVLIALVAGAIYASNIKDNSVKVYPSKVLVDKKVADIEKIDVTNKKNEHFVITPTMVGTDQKWSIDTVAYADVDQSSTDLFATRAYYLEATKVIGELDMNNLDQYGLKDPTTTVSVKYFGDDNMRTFYLGNAYSDGSYYLYEKGVNELYIIPDYVGQDWVKSLNQLRILPGISVASTDMATIKLDRKGQQTVLVSYIPGVLAGTNSWQILQPVHVQTDDDKFSTYLQAITDFKCTGFIADKVGTDAAKYGFDAPQATISIMDYKGEATQTILLGNVVSDTDATRYCILLSKGEKIQDAVVYSIATASQTMFNMQLLDVINPFVYSSNINWVTSGEFTIDGKTYNLKVERTPKLNDDGKPTYDSNNSPITINKYYINDILLNEDQFKTFYGKFLMIQIVGTLPTNYTQGQEIFSYDFKVTVPITDQTTNVTTYKDMEYAVKLCEVDTNFLSLQNNESDAVYFKVERRSIDSISQALALLLAGKLPTV